MWTSASSRDRLINKNYLHWTVSITLLFFYISIQHFCLKHSSFFVNFKFYWLSHILNIAFFCSFCLPLLFFCILFIFKNVVFFRWKHRLRWFSVGFSKLRWWRDKRKVQSYGRYIRFRPTTLFERWCLRSFGAVTNFYETRYVRKAIGGSRGDCYTRVPPPTISKRLACTLQTSASQDNRE